VLGVVLLIALETFKEGLPWVERMIAAAIQHVGS
jgi:hypothetical protein